MKITNIKKKKEIDEISNSQIYLTRTLIKVNEINHKIYNKNCIKGFSYFSLLLDGWFSFYVKI